jgi:hypothetical protein
LDDKFITKNEFESLYDNVHRVKKVVKTKGGLNKQPIKIPEKYKKMHYLKRNILVKLFDSISAMKFSAIDVFKLFDTNKSGDLSEIEFKQSLD